MPDEKVAEETLAGQLSAKNQAETIALEVFNRGDLEIAPCGEIWRVAKRSRKQRRIKCARRRAESKCKNGYLKIQVVVNGTKTSVYAHRLVWLLLRGDIPRGFTPNHKNGIKHDNRPENLELASRSDQILHAYYVLGRTMGKYARGQR